MRSERSSRSEKLERLHRNTRFCSIQMQYRHLARYRLMWMPVILICSAQADISSTDRKESEFLYIRKGVKIRSFVHGGAQERKRRAGTENVPGIVGMGAAVERAMRTMETRTAKERKLRDYLIERIETEIPYCRLNGDRTNRLPNNVNFSFRFIEGEFSFDHAGYEGICASSGSACTSGSLDPSHVLLAIGLPHEIAHGSLRMTLGEETTREDLDYTVDTLKEIVANLRSMSPLYEDFIKNRMHNKRSIDMYTEK